MASVLILFAHPALQKSRVHRVLAELLHELPGVSFHDLYEAYPELDINVKEEQRLLLEHELIVFQHPLFWYSTPAILKEWQDLVLEHGWAYGSRGRALRGKKLMSAISTGGRQDAYQHVGYNRFTVRELLAPIAQTAFLCGMEYLPPFVVYGTHRMTPEEIRSHGQRYRELIAALRDERLDWHKVRGVANLNTELGQVLLETSEAKNGS
jgi:glutathione-regulated potassium-efflux system ancillary protein KefG